MAVTSLLRILLPRSSGGGHGVQLLLLPDLMAQMMMRGDAATRKSWHRCHYDGVWCVVAAGTGRPPVGRRGTW